MLQWFLTLAKVQPPYLVYKNLRDLIPAHITHTLFCHFLPHLALAKAVLISLLRASQALSLLGSSAPLAWNVLSSTHFHIALPC